MARIAAVLTVGAVALALVLSLAGCSKTVHVTAKYRSLVGLYWLCDGPSWYPCGKYDRWRVSKAQYDQAVVGRTYTIH